MTAAGPLFPAPAPVLPRLVSCRSGEPPSPRPRFSSPPLCLPESPAMLPDAQSPCPKHLFSGPPSGVKLLALMPPRVPRGSPPLPARAGVGCTVNPWGWVVKDGVRNTFWPKGDLLSSLGRTLSVHLKSILVEFGFHCLLHFVPVVQRTCRPGGASP